MAELVINHGAHVFEIGHTVKMLMVMSAEGMSHVVAHAHAKLDEPVHRIFSHI